MLTLRELMTVHNSGAQPLGSVGGMFVSSATVVRKLRKCPKCPSNRKGHGHFHEPLEQEKLKDGCVGAK